MPMGKRSCVITLPSSWLQSQGLAAGDTVAVETEGTVLVVSSQKTKKLRGFNAGIQSLDVMLNRCIGALYKAGYDDVMLTINKDQIKTIQDVLRRTLVGFEIVKVTASSIHIQRIAELDTLDVDTLIKQIFFSLQVTGEELVLALRERDAAKIADVARRDDPVNRLADSARRYLNKQKGDCIAYAFVEQLENIGDAYKHIAQRHAHMKRISPHTLDRTNGLLKRIYGLYYDFSLEELEAFGVDAKDVAKEIGEQEVLFSLYSQVFNIQGLALTKTIGTLNEKKGV